MPTNAAAPTWWKSAWRYFPIPSHTNAINSAVAVEAAAQQGKFEEMYKRMYDTQSEWGEQQDSKAALFRGFAQELGLDLTAYDKAVAEIYSRHPDCALYASLPGSGPVFGPRLAAVMGEDRSQYASPSALQCRSGIAPIRRQSGKKCATVRRNACPRFERQTFHEWAGETIPKCAWAKAFYQSQIAAGKLHHTALRALAFKWQRILWRCWQDGTPYDEAKYEAALAAKGSPLSAKIAALRAAQGPGTKSNPPCE
jgi:hypothetical protein